MKKFGAKQIRWLEAVAQGDYTTVAKESTPSIRNRMGRDGYVAYGRKPGDPPIALTDLGREALRTSKEILKERSQPAAA